MGRLRALVVRRGAALEWDVELRQRPNSAAGWQVQCKAQDVLRPELRAQPTNPPHVVSPWYVIQPPRALPTELLALVMLSLDSHPLSIDRQSPGVAVPEPSVSTNNAGTSVMLAHVHTMPLKLALLVATSAHSARARACIVAILLAAPCISI